MLRGVPVGCRAGRRRRRRRSQGRCGGGGGGGGRCGESSGAAARRPYEMAQTIKGRHGRAARVFCSGGGGGSAACARIPAEQRGGSPAACEPRRRRRFERTVLCSFVLCVFLSSFVRDFLGNFGRPAQSPAAASRARARAARARVRARRGGRARPLALPRRALRMLMRASGGDRAPLAFGA